MSSKEYKCKVINYDRDELIITLCNSLSSTNKTNIDDVQKVGGHRG